MEFTSKIINTAELLPPFEDQFSVVSMENLEIRSAALEIRKKVSDGRNLCILLGSSGVGRDTILEACLDLRKRSFDRIKRITTRQIRGPADFSRMIFTDEKTFLKDFKKGQIVFAGRYRVNSKLYGINQNELLKLKNKEKLYFLEATLVALPLKKLFPLARLILILPPSKKVLKERLASRDNWLERFNVSWQEVEVAQKSAKEMVNAGWVDLVLFSQGRPKELAQKICERLDL
jgi:guanylate kinase